VTKAANAQPTTAGGEIITTANKVYDVPFAPELCALAG